MIKQIVVGVDSSDTAFAAAHRAAELASALGAELTVMTAFGKFERETVTLGGETFVLSTEDDARSVAGSVVNRLRAEFPSARMKADAEEGKPGEALVRLADFLRADLIIVGNKRAQGLTRVLGSVARDVTAHANCDVYVAHTV
ncbi:universal stress protein [Dietzia sp. CH92]|uniref:universal stress protein n=1 Tax=Dietzia sp. CH92 TaxID=3051823 RepID=UPI0028D5D785|nr:universal stress protein [Dietzia sp. CH92]